MISDSLSEPEAFQGFDKQGAVQSSDRFPAKGRSLVF